jgi:hypothetical protein
MYQDARLERQVIRRPAGEPDDTTDDPPVGKGCSMNGSYRSLAENDDRELLDLVAAGLRPAPLTLADVTLIGRAAYRFLAARIVAGGVVEGLDLDRAAPLACQCSTRSGPGSRSGGR